MLDYRMKQHQKVMEETCFLLKDSFAKACILLENTIRNGNKILICGNGGSMSDSLHFGAELVGKLEGQNRNPLKCVVLGANPSLSTAISNDYGFDLLFQRELIASGSRGDVLFALSTSGNSPNIINAVKEAKELGINVIGMTGKTGGELSGYCEILLNVPNVSTPLIQEIHIFLIHSLCYYLEGCFFNRHKEFRWEEIQAGDRK